MHQKLPLRLQVAYAVGQLGSAMLIGIINSFLMFYYIPPQASGIPVSIPQVTYFGVFTIIGLITMAGRLTDAVTDPWIATLSDRSRSRRGRRISFMGRSAAPFAILTVLVFWTPVQGVSAVNAVCLSAALLLFYFFMTMYVTPHYALIAELGHSSAERVNLSTFISVTYLIGLALSSLTPVLWNFFVDMGYGKPDSMRIAIALMACLAFILMMVPVMTINERKYTETSPSELKMLSSVKATFRNREFRIFAYSSVTYWVAMTLFQSALLYYITVLLGLPENLFGILFVLLGAGALVLHGPVNLLTKKLGNKKLLIIGFIGYIVVYAFGFGLGKFPISTTSQAYLLVGLAAFPSAIFGIVPTVIIADIAKYDAHLTGTSREGMFFGTRTFVTKIGQMISMLIFSALLMVDADGRNAWGIRLTAAAAVLFCFLGMMLMMRYDEEKINTASHDRLPLKR